MKTFDRYLTHRYWNTNGIATVIVAVKGNVNDWAAYIGGSRYVQKEEDAVIDIVKYGNKLTKEDAYRFLPSMKQIEQEMNLINGYRV